MMDPKYKHLIKKILIFTIFYWFLIPTILFIEVYLCIYGRPPSLNELVRDIKLIEDIPLYYFAFYFALLTIYMINVDFLLRLKNFLRSLIGKIVCE